MDLNERIARLLEPVPSIDECEENRHSDAFGWIGTRHDGWVPATFKESIDASLLKLGCNLFSECAFFTGADRVGMQFGLMD